MSLPRRGHGEKESGIIPKSRASRNRNLFRKRKLAFQTLRGISKLYKPLEMQLIHETFDGTRRTMTFLRILLFLVLIWILIDSIHQPHLKRCKQAQYQGLQIGEAHVLKNHNVRFAWVSTPNHTGFTPVGCLLRITSQMTVFHQRSSVPPKNVADGKGIHSHNAVEKSTKFAVCSPKASR